MDRVHLTPILDGPSTFEDATPQEVAAVLAHHARTGKSLPGFAVRNGQVRKVATPEVEPEAGFGPADAYLQDLIGDRPTLGQVQMEITDRLADSETVVEAAALAAHNAIEGKNILVGSPGKNLFQESTATLGKVISGGSLATSATYITSDYIPVIPGEVYTVSANGPVYKGPRKVAFFNEQKAYIAGSEIDHNQSVLTAPAPAGSAFLMASWNTDLAPFRQVEVGSAATGYEPYRVTAGISLTTDQVGRATHAPVTVQKVGETFYVTTYPQGRELRVETRRAESPSGLFNITNTTLDGVAYHTSSDDATPIRTFNTVGANHGYTCIASYKVAGHGKTQADLGSVYTDGTLEYTLLIVEGDELVFGGPYTSNSAGNVGTSTKPKADLTHLSGGTNTATVPIAVAGSMTQLRPIAKKVSVRYLLDGKEIVSDGVHAGEVLRIFETYEIPDYGLLIDWARANVGEDFRTAEIGGQVRVSNVFTYRSEGRCTVSSTLTALRTVQLTTVGFVQSVALSMSGHTLHRYVPGVHPVGGWDLSTPQNMAAWDTTIHLGPGDLKDENHPPSILVDWLRDGEGQDVIGFAIGYVPDKTDNRDEKRKDLAVMWDLRSTKKIYPNTIYYEILQPGEVRTFEAFRNFLLPHPSGATVVNVVEDEAATYVHIDFHKSVVAQAIPLPEHIGKSATVYYSDGLTLLNDVVSADGLLVTVPGASGRAIVKLV